MASSIPHSLSLNTFNHNITPPEQKPAHSASTSARQPMSPTMFERALQDWVNTEDKNSIFQKQLAAKRISTAYKERSRELNLGGLGLYSLPSAIGEFTHLTCLDIKQNKLTSLPPSIGQLTNLTWLDLTNNQLTALPKEIGQLTNLTGLNLSKNQRTTLPKEIGQLTKLTYLGLDNNQLTTLPKEIGQLTELTWLNLTNNQLTTLPKEIGRLTKLTYLDLDDNPLTTLPIGLRDSGFADKHDLQDTVDREGYYTGTRQLNNGVREEGRFEYIKKTKRTELIDGIVTKPNGTRKQLTNGHYSWLRFGMKYKTTRLSPVDPLSQSTKRATPEALTQPQPSRPTPTVETSTPNPVARVSPEEMTQWPDSPQEALTLQAKQPADKLQRFFSSDLGNLVAMPQLPPHLHSSEPHRQFFQGFTDTLNAHYCMLRSVSVGANEEDASIWVKDISTALKALSLPGTGVAGDTINTIAQKLAQAHAETKAQHIVQQFATDIHFTITARHVGVLLTQYMDQVPEASNSFLKDAKRLLKTIKTKAHMPSDNPYKHMPKVLDAYTAFLKTVKKNPSLINNDSGLGFQEYCETAAMQLVSKALGITIERGESSNGPSHGSGRGKRPVVEDIETESSSAADRRLHSHSLQLHELSERLERVEPRVQQHEKVTHALLTDPNVEFDNLKDMVTASAHYLRRFGVINYANTPITVRLADGREVGLADRLERLHNKQPNAAAKPYRPRTELQRLICKLAKDIGNRADLDTQRGQRILGGIVAQRTNPNKTHEHNLDVVKMVTYYLRKFNLVNYTHGEARIQLSDEAVNVAHALARLHAKQPRAHTKQYDLQSLLGELISELPDAVKNNVDMELDENAAMLMEVEQRMSNKRKLQATRPVSLREVAREARERQQLFGN